MLQLLECLKNQSTYRQLMILTTFRKDVADSIPPCIAKMLRPPQWVVLVQDHYRTINHLTPDESKKKYLGKVTKNNFKILHKRFFMRKQHWSVRKHLFEIVSI